MKRLIWAVLLSCTVTVSYATGNDGNNAEKLCAMIDAANLSSAPCTYSAWGKTMTATFDMSSSEARKLCGRLSNLAKQSNLFFSSGWKLQINSPYSKGSIAFCDL